MSQRRPQLDHATAAGLAVVEYARCLEVLDSLQRAEWDQPTDCPDWTVRQMACHMLGAIEIAASMREALRQLRAANRLGGEPVDALTRLQVEERRDWTPDRIVKTFRTRAPKAAARRRTLPALVRRSPMPAQRINGVPEGWTLGFLTDVVLTRDAWMHRVDICRATGRESELTADHDGVIVADVVAEWLGRHGQPVVLTLDGPAGGHWEQGDEGPSRRHDAVDFCRVLSGRSGDVTRAELFDAEVPF